VFCLVPKKGNPTADCPLSPRISPNRGRFRSVLARDPLLDFLIGGAWSKRLMLAGLTQAYMASSLVSTTHAARRLLPGCALYRATSLSVRLGLTLQRRI